MKKLLLLFLVLPALIYAGSGAYFTSEPTISPDAETIVFAYESDLWSVPTDGGRAVRLTGMDGMETNPVFSPDGKWIAFSSTQDGNSNIYIIPVAGGEIKQLTYHSAADKVESWSWDSKYVYFTSNRYNSFSAYKVKINGETPVRLFDHYFNNTHNLAVHPKTNELFFNETWESYRFANRKRYKGDYNPDIKSYNFETKEFKQYTTYRGKDLWATIDKEGNIYFASDEANDEYNLYTFENGDKKQLTKFETAIGRPRVSTNGKKVVFTRDYQIFAYDVSGNKSEKIDIVLFDNNTLDTEQEFNVSGKISNYNVSHDNKKIAFVSRGELFVSDIKGKFVKHIKTNPKERVSEVIWLKDNKTVLFTQTADGWHNLFTIKVDEPSKEKQITSEEQNNYELQINNDRTKALYFSGRNDLRVLDLESLKSETIVEDEFWALGSDAAHFSSDDKWVVYTAIRNFESDILVYSFDEDKSYNITKTGVSESSPFWSPDGKYIYFSSDRLDTSYPNGTKNKNVYRIALENIDKEFKSDNYDKLFVDKEEKKDTTKPTVNIDFEDLNKRWETIDSHPGNQNGPYVTKKDNKTSVLFLSNHDDGGYGIWKTDIEPFEKNKTEKIKGIKRGSLFINKAKDKFYVLSGGDIYTLNISGNKAEKIKISYKFSRNLDNEFDQMFYETWAGMEENFYSETFHGIDWKEMKNRYKKYLPYVRSRDNLRLLLNDMLGELNASHLGFRSTGDEEKSFYKSATSETGILFENNNPYKVAKIVTASAADKKDKNIKPGDILVSVNDEKVDTKVNREKYFVNPERPEEFELVFKRDGKEHTVKLHSQSSGSLRTNLYDEWVDWNQNFVDSKSDNRIAYVHMKNMVGGQLNNFLIEMTNEAHYKEALILDLRYNTGGNVHDEVLNFLSQKPYAKWKYREGEFTPQPNFAPASKPIVLLINEQSLSDAEMTAAGFKELKLGKIIGTETYRWLIFTSGKSLVDGSYYRMPAWGCYTLDGKNIETNGVAPDIYVKQTFKDRVEGKDPQLDKAIEEILNDLNR